MPQYKVIAVGFFGGVMYSPEGKRKTLHTDTPFKKGKLPTWLEEMKPETAAQKKKREAAAKVAAESAAEQAEQDEKAIEDASFLGEGESGGNVETL